MSKQIKFLAVLLIAFTIVSCGDDDDNSSQIPQVIFNCCDNTTLNNQNIDNLDQSAGEILVTEVITVNGDGLNDVFRARNLDLYPNNEVTIFNLNDEVIFNAVNYGSADSFPNSNITSFAEGTYRYRIVVEDEQTYVNNGFFCLIKPLGIDQANDYNGIFTSCFVLDPNDPFL